MNKESVGFPTLFFYHILADLIVYDFIMIWAARHRRPTFRPCAVGLSALTRCPPTMRRKAQICFRFAQICSINKTPIHPTLTLVNVLPSLPRSPIASPVGPIRFRFA